MTADTGTVRRVVNRWHCLDQRANLLIGELSVLDNFHRTENGNWEHAT